MPCAVILTALPVEYSAVRTYLTALHEEHHPQSDVYERGQFAGKGQIWDIGLVEIGLGNPVAAAATERAIAYFNPEVVLFVGVAGGIKDKNIALGDVVAATKIYGYESGKTSDKFRPRPSIGLASHSLIEQARAEARKMDWLRLLKVIPEIHPRAVVLPIATGEKVIASTQSETFQLLRESFGDAVAVEMEGLGFLEAARKNERVSAMVIRGISDLIDGKEELDKSGYQEIAAHHASAFAFAILSNLTNNTRETENIASEETNSPQYKSAFRAESPMIDREEIQSRIQGLNEIIRGYSANINRLEKALCNACDEDKKINLESSIEEKKNKRKSYEQELNQFKSRFTIADFKTID